MTLSPTLFAYLVAEFECVRPEGSL